MLRTFVKRPEIRSPWAVVAPVALLLTVACAAPPPEAERVVRLLERAPEIVPPSAAWSPPAGLELALATLDPVDPPPGLGSAPLAEPDGEDARTGFFGPVGTRYRFPGLPGQGGELRVAVGAWAAGKDPGPVEFRIDAGGGPDRTALLELSLTPSAEDRWRTLRVPLPEDESSQQLSFSTAAGEPGAWAAWGTPEVVRPGPVRRPPNVILISLDTLRADRLGSYGYARRPTSPELDAFAARSLRFRNAVAQAPWTRPSHRAMFSGRYPSFVVDKSRYLAGRLWGRGYRTLALTGGGQVDRKLGFARGFESYRKTSWIHRPEAVIEALDESPDRSFFLFLHTYEIHDPFTDRRFAQRLPRGRVGRKFGNRQRRYVHDIRPEEKAYIEALYDGDLAFTDSKLGELLDRFEERGLLETSIVLVTSDHGEEFWEHGRWRHGHSFYEELLRVPMILWLPPDLRARFATAFPAGSGRAAVIEEQVGLIDIVPTILELLDLPRTEDLQGRSMVPLLAAVELPERPLLGERLNPVEVRIPQKALRTNRIKLILPTRARPDDPGWVGPELYDLSADPGELTNLAAEHRELVARLSEELQRLAAGGSEDAGAEDVDAIDEELRRELEALGYIGG